MKRNQPTKKTMTEADRIKENRKIFRTVQQALKHRDERVDPLCRGCVFAGQCTTCLED